MTGDSVPLSPAPLSPSLDGAGNDALRAQLQEVFADRYRVDDVIGRGQCSTTFLGVRIGAADRVALKVLTVDPVTNPGVAQRVADEIRVSQEVASACHLVPDRFEKRGPLAVIVMPYMPGGSLESLVRDDALAPVSRIEEIVRSVAATLDCMHGRGALHLGLTPGNILFDARGRAVVSDRGLTNVMLDAEGVHGTRSSRARAYAAPEQRRKQSVDARADQYALAVIAFELLSGHRRLDEEMVQGIHTLAPIEVLPDVPLRAKLPLYVNAALRRALSANAANRFATTTEFAEALAGRAPESAPGLSTTRADLRLRRRRRIASAFGVLLAILVLATIADPGLRDVVRTTWRAVRAQLAWAPRRIDVAVDPGATSAPAPSSPQHEAGTGANMASRSDAGVATIHARANSPVSPGPARTATDAASSPVGSTPVVVRLGSSSSGGTPIANAPAPPALSGGKAVLANAGSWLRRTFGGSWLRNTSSTAADIHVSVDRGSAIVFVDGIPRGSAPATISVAPGHHTISVAGTLDYGSNPTGINAASGEKISVPFHSTPNP